MRWKAVFDYGDTHFSADNPKNLIGKIMRSGICSAAQLLATLEEAGDGCPFREAAGYWLQKLELQ